MTARVLALSGGVGGAKLALGLSKVLAAEALTVVVNTGDDFEHLGLYVCPDIDTLIYTLAGLSNPDAGWGRAGETWSFMGALGQLDGPTWFKLGDKDLAVNVTRTAQLRDGVSLSTVTESLARCLGVAATVAPISDDPVRTRVRTPEGWIGFQDYFVRLRCQPRVLDLEYEGAANAVPSAAFKLALQTADVVVICPSNPYLSIDPMLSVAGVADALATAKGPVIAVSPLVGGQAIKGPTAKIMAELGIEQSALGIAAHYQGLIDGLVLDVEDESLAGPIREMGIAVTVTQTVMETLEDRIRLAGSVLEFAQDVARADSEIRTKNVGTGSR